MLENIEQELDGKDLAEDQESKNAKMIEEENKASDDDILLSLRLKRSFAKSKSGAKNNDMFKTFQMDLILKQQ